MERTDKLKQRLTAAFEWLARIPVRGEAVDHMAMARQELRAAWALTEEKPDTEVKDNE